MITSFLLAFLLGMAVAAVNFVFGYVCGMESERRDRLLCRIAGHTRTLITCEYPVSDLCLHCGRCGVEVKR